MLKHKTLQIKRDTLRQMSRQAMVTVCCRGYTHLVVTVGALLLALWRSGLRRAVGSVLLSLPLRVVRILAWTALGGA